MTLSVSGMTSTTEARVERTWLEREIQDLFDGLDLFVWRRMQYDDDGSDETYRAADLA